DEGRVRAAAADEHAAERANPGLRVGRPEEDGPRRGALGADHGQLAVAEDHHAAQLVERRLARGERPEHGPEHRARAVERVALRERTLLAVHRDVPVRRGERQLVAVLARGAG
ncbi:MAG: hypothetical protein ACK559_39690, partial [bacterium]